MSFLDAHSYRLPNSIYTAQAILDSQGPYSQYTKVRVSDVTNDSCKIEVEIEQQFKERSREIKGELLNYILASAAVGMIKKNA